MKCYIVKRKENTKHLYMLSYLYGVFNNNELFQRIPTEEYVDVIEKTDDINSADFFLLPHLLRDCSKNADYVSEINSLTDKAQKKLIVFAHQDGERIDKVFDNAIYLRASVYKSEISHNDIVIPPMSEDLSKFSTIKFEKKAKPTVCFMGQLGPKDLIRKIWSYIKSYLYFGNIKGSGFATRRVVIKSILKDKKIISDIIIRPSYSAHLKTISDKPDKIRQEYIAQMQGADYVLAPRGDGNYSLRFFEALSMGVLPIVPDTDIALPLENKIPYDDFIIRVPLKEIDHTNKIILDFHNGCSESEYKNKRAEAINYFKNNLYQPIFLRRFFSEVLPQILKNE